MTRRMPTKDFVNELAAALNRGDGYIMGSYGQNPRTGYLDLSRTDVKSSWKETGLIPKCGRRLIRRSASRWASTR